MLREGDRFGDRMGIEEGRDFDEDCPCALEDDL